MKSTETRTNCNKQQDNTAIFLENKWGQTHMEQHVNALEQTKKNNFRSQRDR